MQKSWRITRASKSLEFHPGKKEIGEWIWSGWYSPSGLLLLQFLEMDDDVENLSGQTRPEFRDRRPVCGFQSCRSREQCGRARDVVARDRRTNVRPPPPFTISRRTKEERRKKSLRIRGGLVPHASSQRPFVERGTIDSNFHAHGRKGGKVVAFSCGTFCVLCSLTFSFVWNLPMPQADRHSARIFYLLAIT